MLLIVFVLWGILGGVFTATEASAVAVVWAFVLAVICYREIPWKALPSLITGSARTTGIVMIANLCIGLCTPPVGTCLFLGSSVGKSNIASVSKEMIPFYLAMIAGLAVITAWPDLSLWLPKALGAMD